MIGRTLDRLRDVLHAKFFLYETTADLEPLLVCISAQTHPSALLKDVREGRRMSNRQIEQLYFPERRIVLPPDDGRAQTHRYECGLRDPPLKFYNIQSLRCRGLRWELDWSMHILLVRLARKEGLG